MIRAEEHDREEEANEKMIPIYPIVNAQHSIYMDDPAFRESIESGVLYSSTILSRSGNVIGGKAALILDFACTINEFYIYNRQTLTIISKATRYTVW